MGLNNKQYEINALAEIDSTGFAAALFPQIRDAYIRKMMEIYGADIDVSSASADGQFINMEALILNNIYRVLESVAKNMSPSTASGKYLDILTGLSNIYRQNETFSTCQVYIKNISGSPWKSKSITCVDKSGLEWIWFNPINFDRSLQETITADEVRTITLTCKNLGANIALGTGTSYAAAVTAAGGADAFWSGLSKETNGDIYQPTDNGIFKIYHASDAVPGKNRETDSQLRNKKLNLIGSGSVTVLESLKSRLLSIEGIKDCYVTHNISATSGLVQSDGVTVDYHNVYIVLRYEEGVDVSSWDIGTTIYKALTPGVLTQEYVGTGAYGTSKSNELTVVSGQSATMYWKKCKVHNPNITLTFNASVTTFTDQQQQLIKDILKDYLNNVSLNEPITAAKIQTLFLAADLKPNGFSTYFPTGCTIANIESTTYKNYLTYCNFVDADFVFNMSLGTLTIGYIG